MEGKDVYILLAFALLRRRRPASPHRRSPCRFTGDHTAHHVDDALLGLTPEHGHFSNNGYASHRRVPYKRASYERVPHGRAPHEYTPHRRAFHGRVPWACTS
jgi:hypothetical protein